MYEALSPGDTWPSYYRGFRLHTNAEREVWWQVYQGTDRLYLDPTPERLVEELLATKRLGGRVRVTEGSDVITRVEDGDDYETRYVGELELQGNLVPADAPEFSVPLRPDGLSSGDLWPSVYDGAKYSFDGQGNAWWSNPATGKRHPVETPIDDALAALSRHKPQGGSFRVTPWDDVITLVPVAPATDDLRDQFGALPRVVKNIIKLRKERGVEMLPLYVGTVERTPIEVGAPVSLTAALSEEEQSELESWAESLGATTTTDASDRRVEDRSSTTDGGPSETDHDTGTADDEVDKFVADAFDDDPEDW